MALSFNRTISTYVDKLELRLFLFIVIFIFIQELIGLPALNDVSRAGNRIETKLLPFAFFLLRDVLTVPTYYVAFFKSINVMLNKIYGC